MDDPRQRKPSQSWSMEPIANVPSHDSKLYALQTFIVWMITRAHITAERATQTAISPADRSEMKHEVTCVRY